jgi:hypothetical protein
MGFLEGSGVTVLYIGHMVPKGLFYFFCLFWTNVQSKRTTRAEPEDHLWSADHSLINAALSDTTGPPTRSVGLIFGSCDADRGSSYDLALTLEDTHGRYCIQCHRGSGVVSQQGHRVRAGCIVIDDGKKLHTRWIF